MAKTCAVMLGEGFEEVEALASVDCLRRAGVEVTMVSVMRDQVVQGSHKIAVTADAKVGEVDLGQFDLIVLPGGMPGTTNLGECEELREAVVNRMAAGLKVSAICAAPSLLAKWGVLEGRVATCYPGFETEFPEGVRPDKLGVYYDDNLITASGPGFAVEFGLANVKTLCGEGKADEVAKAMLVK